MNELSDVRLIKPPQYVDADGLLVVTEAGAQVPFEIQRMFTIVAPAGAKRGQHAHRLCSQFMLCVNGAVDIVCDDGRDRKTFSLDRPERRIWCCRESGLTSMLGETNRFSSSCATGYTKSTTISAITTSFCHFAKPRGHEDCGYRCQPVSSCVTKRAGACVYLFRGSAGPTICSQVVHAR